MQSAGLDIAVPQAHVYKSPSHYQRQQHARKYFTSVIEAYLEMQASSPIAACNYDPGARIAKRTPVVIEYIADVELATHRMLDPSGLFSTWQRLIADDAKVAPETADRIINLCARIYEQRHLVPYRYFRHTKTRASQRAA